MRFRKKIGVLSLVSSLLFVHPLVIDEANAQETDHEEIEDEVAEENLELPDIYENTIIYNGTINPDFQVRISGPASSDHVETPHVNDEGQFSVNFSTIISETEGLEAGNFINIALYHEEYLPYSFNIEVLPAEEGMELVESSVDTSEVQNSVREATQFDWQEQEEAILLNIETVGDVEGAPYYTVNNEPITEENRLEHIDGNLNRTYFTPDSLNIGDTVTVYVVASGVTTPVEVEVPDTLTSLQDTSEEQPVESEEPDDDTDDEDPDGESEDQNDGEDDESDIDDEENLDEVDPPETEGAEDENEGLSTGWIIAGVILGLAVIGGIVFAIMKGKQSN